MNAKTTRLQTISFRKQYSALHLCQHRHSQSTRANLNLQWSIIPMLNVGLYAGGSYRDIKADSPELKDSNSGWQGDFNLNVDYTFPFRLRMSAYGGGGTGWIDLQSKGSGYNYYGISLSRSFLKEDASLSPPMALTSYSHTVRGNTRKVPKRRASRMNTATGNGAWGKRDIQIRSFENRRKAHPS